jgi:hypothetical protein
MSNYCKAQKQLDDCLGIITSRATNKQSFVEATLCLTACELPDSIIGDLMETKGVIISTIEHGDMVRIFERCVFMLESALDEFEAEHDAVWDGWIASKAAEAIMEEEEPYRLLEVGKPFPLNKEGEF